MMYLNDCFISFIKALRMISEYDREKFQYDMDPPKDTVAYAYMSHNRDAKCMSIAGFEDFYDVIITIKRTEPLSDQYLRNLNVMSPYRYRVTNHVKTNEICRNLFIDDMFVGMPISEISADSTRAKHYINNVLSMTINMIAGHFPELEVDHRNMFGIVVTTIICTKLGIAITPEFLADALGTTKTIAEAVIEKYDYGENQYIGLPWYI